MLYNIIFAFVIIISVAVIIFIISKKIPAADLPKKKDNEPQIQNGRKFNTKKLINIFIVWCERVFRKVKILALKLDTKISKWLKNLNHWKNKNKVAAEKIEKDSSELIQKADNVHYSQLKQTTQRPQIKDNINIAHILGEKEKRKTKEEEVVLGNSEIYSENECINMIAKNPRNIKAYHTLADIYIKQKNFSDAQASLHQILKFDVHNVNAKLKLRKIRDLPQRRNSKE